MKKEAFLFLAVLLSFAMLQGCSSKEKELQANVEAFVKVDEYEKAIELLDSFIDENPTNPFGRELKIDVLLHKNSIEAALEQYGKYVKLTGENSAALLRKIMKYSLSDASGITEHLIREEYTTKSKFLQTYCWIFLKKMN